MIEKEKLSRIRSEFCYVNEDIYGNRRLFFDNAGGSLRLKAAEDTFHRIDEMPDASEHSNRAAVYLAELEEGGRRKLKEILFGSKKGALFTGYTASGLMMEMTRIISEHASGTNYVTTILEHPSAFDAMTHYARKNGCELRVAGANLATGGVNEEEIISLIDKNTAILCCMAASNISGYVFDLEWICRKARQINPDIYIICDAVQHAPHGVLDPDGCQIDAMNFAPYKFFGVRGFSAAYLSERASCLEHHKLMGKAENDWELGSPATAQLVSFGQVIDYVIGLGAWKHPLLTDQRKLFEAGMQIIAEHEQGLLEMMLEGTGHRKGLRYIPGLKVQMDGKNLKKRDLILSVEFEGMNCREAAKQYEECGVVAFERSYDSLYSRRMLEAFNSKGVVRLSPLHVNTPEEIEEFLEISASITGRS